MSEDFEDTIKRLANSRNGEAFLVNKDRTPITVEELFLNALNKVDILFCDFRLFGTAKMIEKARIFLSDPRRKVRILIEKPEVIDPEMHVFVKEFLGNNRVEFRKITTNYKSEFVVMDGDSYLCFEKNIKTLPLGVGSFGDIEGAKKLTDDFDVLWKQSHECEFHRELEPTL